MTDTIQIKEHTIDELTYAIEMNLVNYSRRPMPIKKSNAAQNHMLMIPQKVPRNGKRAIQTKSNICA